MKIFRMSPLLLSQFFVSAVAVALPAKEYQASRSKFVPAETLGDVARNTVHVLSLFEKFLMATSLTLGLLFLFAAIIQFRDHRKNPVQIPISKPIFYLIFALLFVGFVILSRFSPVINVFR